MHNNYFFIKQLAAEIGNKILNGNIVSILSKHKDEVLIYVEKNNEISYLKLYLHPSFCCLTFWQNSEMPHKGFASIFPEIHHKKITKVSVIENDRCILIETASAYKLVFKLYGNRSNLLLLENNAVNEIFNKSLAIDIDFDTQKAAKKSEVNELIFNEKGEKWQSLFPTFDKKILAHLPQNPTWHEIEKVNTQLHKNQFFICKNEKSEWELGMLPPLQEEYFYKSAIEAVNKFFILFVSELTINEEKKKGLAVLNKQISLCEKYIKSTQVKLDYLLNSIPPEQIADVIMANLHQIKTPFENTEIELFNFYNNENFKVRIKRNQSPQKLAESYYKKSKNRKKELDTLFENIEIRQIELADLTNKRNILNACNELKAIKQLNTNYGLVGKKAIEKQATDLFKVINVMGFTVYVGKNASNNDLLLKNHTFKDDLWLHAKDVSGSHLIIKHIPGNPFPKNMVERVAAIAAWHSQRRTDGLCPVICTARKYVHKPKGAAPGLVRVLREENILLVKPEKWEGE